MINVPVLSAKGLTGFPLLKHDQSLVSYYLPKPQRKAYPVECETVLCVCVLITHSCPTLWDLMDCGLPASYYP